MSITPPDDGLKGLAPIEPLPPGVIPNRASQSNPGFLTGAPYELAIVEFDDQGRCYSREQLTAVSARLDDLASRNEDVILLAFVHGWQHNARTNDDNLSAFRQILARTVKEEQIFSTEGGTRLRKVLGVYVGWRGLSLHGLGDVVADGTFWGRQEAARRVSTGSVRELFGYLRRYRKAQLDNHGSPLLVIAGHSFGGLIVYSALAQSLVEAASTAAREIVSGFADLVLLANPAFEGARYLPIYDIVSAPEFARRTAPQLPVFICVQAENDQPVGTWFPLGNLKSRIDESVIGKLEQQCITHGIGFIQDFQTHRISRPDGKRPFVLDPVQQPQNNPFWVVAATKEVVDGHGGIWLDPFMSFLAAILFQHVMSKARPGSGPAQPRTPAAAVYPMTAPGVGAIEQNLVDYAASIDPLVIK